MAGVLSTRLTCHPTTPASPVGAIEVTLARGADRLALTFTISGDLERVRVPAAVTPRRGDRLWEHTCCEAFISAGGGDYHELNFSPSGAWAGYAFRGYRERSGDSGNALAVPLRVERDGDRLTLAAEVVLSCLSARYAAGALRVGCAAVIEADDGSLSYWAVRHAPGRPDFHHADAFALTLEAPRRE